MELSIIVAVYNMADDVRLEYCLNSLLNQTISDYEIIVVDDASTDNTSQILLDFAAHYPDVLKVFLAAEYSGRGGARNMGLKHARGKWVGFVECCDWVAPDMYEKLLKRAGETGADMVACDYHLALEHSSAVGEIVREHYEEQTGPLDIEKYKHLLVDSGRLCTKIYKRKIISDCGMEFPEQLLCDDKAMECAIILRAKHFAYVPEPLYARCQYGDSAEYAVMHEGDPVQAENGARPKAKSADIKRKEALEIQEYCEHCMEAARIMLNHAQNFGWLKNYREEIEYKFTELFYVNSLQECLQRPETRKAGFLGAVQREMKCTFPGFEENPYYKEKVSEEERLIIHRQQRSTRQMLWRYEVKEFAKHLGKGGWKEFGLKTAGMLLGAVLCLFLAAVVLQDNKTLEYPVVLLGDSIVANDYVGDELNEILTKALGEEVFNGGFGGSYLCNHNLKGYESYFEESLSMEELANSIVTGDFLVQRSVIKKISKLDYYESRLEQLSKIDFDKTKVLIIEHGTNDYAFQISPEQMRESLSGIISKLKKRYPDMQIWISSPTYCYIVRNEENIYCDTTGLGPYMLEEYVLVEEQVCKELGVGFIDNYHQDVITKETLEQYSLDGLHLNEVGRQVIADNILTAMESAAQSE